MNPRPSPYRKKKTQFFPRSTDLSTLREELLALEQLAHEAGMPLQRRVWGSNSASAPSQAHLSMPLARSGHSSIQPSHRPLAALYMQPGAHVDSCA